MPAGSVTHVQDALEQHAVTDPPLVPRLHREVGEPHARDPKLVVGGIQTLELLVLFWGHETWVEKSRWEKNVHRKQKGVDLVGNKNI